MTYSMQDRRIAHSLGVRLDDDPPPEDRIVERSHAACHRRWDVERTAREKAEERCVQAFRDADRLNAELRAERRWCRVWFFAATAAAACLTVRLVIWLGAVCLG